MAVLASEAKKPTISYTRRAKTPSTSQKTVANECPNLEVKKVGLTCAQGGGSWQEQDASVWWRAVVDAAVLMQVRHAVEGVRRGRKHGEPTAAPTTRDGDR
eukprot:scaffold161645_cov27-Tisochrysis_lutea.AAC.1